MFNSVKSPSDRAVAKIGQVATTAPHSVKTAILELTASQEYTAGRVLFRGTDPESQVRPTRSGDVLTYHTFAGFGLVDISKESHPTLQYSNGDSVGVITFGDVAVVTAGAVVAGQTVVAAVATSGLTSAHYTGSLTAGSFRIPGAQWKTSAGSGAVAIVSLGVLGALSFDAVGAVSGSNI